MDDAETTIDTRTLRSTVESDTRRFLSVTRRADGALFFEGCDVGAGPLDYWGEETFSWTILIQADDVATYIAALANHIRSSSGGPELAADETATLDVITECCSRDPLTVTTTFLNDHVIPHDFWSRAGRPSAP